MTAYNRSYVENIGLVFLVLAIIIPLFVFYYTATSHGEPINMADHIAYSLCVYVLVRTLGVGGLVVRDAWKEDKESWIAEQMPPLFLEGGV